MQIPAESLRQAGNHWSITSSIVVQLKQWGSNELVVTWDCKHGCTVHKYQQNIHAICQLHKHNIYKILEQRWGNKACELHLVHQHILTRQQWLLELLQQTAYKWHFMLFTNILIILNILMFQSLAHTC